MAIMCVLQDNRSALHLACEHAHKEVAAKLIDCGADVNWVNSKLLDAGASVDVKNKVRNRPN
eukprot:1194322-Prorocentrum_minimum.AAC.3